MTSQFSSHDEYGFVRPENFDYKMHEEFMNSYLGVLAKRRKKWDALLKDGYHKLDVGSKLKRYIRKGVPNVYRKGVWMQISGAAKLKQEEPDLYQVMLNMKVKNQVIEDQIQTDIPRTFPNNMLFDKTHPNTLQVPLFNILKAFANSNPKIGYCQGINYIAGLILLVTKDEDSTFWLLKVICEKILPEYYTPSMPGLLTDVKVLSQLCRQEVPSLANHIDKMQMPWALFCSKWLICIYAEVLPTETVLRVWDTIFYEGSKIVFRVAIGLLKLNQERLLSKQDFASLAEELKAIAYSRSTVNCHTFLEDICGKTGSLPKATIEKLRSDFGAQVREEQLERERRRAADGSGLKDG